MTELFKKYGHPTPQNPQVGKIKEAFSLLKNARNPQALFSRMAQNNPMYSDAMNLVQQNGGDAQKAFYAYASQLGIDPDEVLNMLH